MRKSSHPSLASFRRSNRLFAEAIFATEEGLPEKAGKVQSTQSWFLDKLCPKFKYFTGHSSTKILLAIFLKFKFNQVSCILFGSSKSGPNGLHFITCWRLLSLLIFKIRVKTQPLYHVHGQQLDNCMVGPKFD